ncbi:hypothetical protein GCM10022278_00350 [Allohahella marinimesophila]|uniref:Uncharacterized protein n=1 Tax=Allohahella marinimesophila TaxID=1054972 RepID=A0ABP7NEV5_9GAMM
MLALEQADQQRGLAAFDQIDPALRQQAVIQYIHAATRSDQLLKGFYARTVYEGLFSEEAYAANRRAIWTTVSSLDTGMLEQIVEAENIASLPGIGEAGFLAETPASQFGELKGWADLTLRLRSRGTLEEYREYWRNWRQDWPGHSAAKQPPEAVQQLSRPDTRYPRKVAVLLPGSGPFKPAADTLKAGFLAAYFQRFGRDERLTSTLGRIHPSQQNSIWSTADVAPELVFFDTAGIENFTDLFMELQVNGFEQVVGPLDKDAVARMASLPQLSPPVLAMNYLDNETAQPPPGLFQFGLSMNDEIEQALSHLGDPAYADQLDRANMRRTLQEEAAANTAMITAQALDEDSTAEALGAEVEPGDLQDEVDAEDSTVTEADDIGRSDERVDDSVDKASMDEASPMPSIPRRHKIAIIQEDAPWARKLAEHAREQAKRYDIEIAHEIIIDRPADLSPQIADMLLIRESNNRRARLQSVVGKLEFEPRRRKDLDGIMVIATPYWLRQIKPLMAFHYARTLPVVAVSMAFDGKQDERKNTDMNGLLFTALPWVVDPEVQASELKQQSAEMVSNPAYSNLFAMGADTFALIDKLELLTIFSSAYVEGYTGELSLMKDGRVRRTFPWGQFVRGQAQLLPKSTTGHLE